jgi:hypothetical protein
VGYAVVMYSRESSKGLNWEQYLKYRLKDLIDPLAWEVASKIVSKRRSTQFTERLSFDSSVESQIYLIRRRPPGAGLFSNVNHVIQGIMRSQELGLSPVVDMKNYWTWYNRGYPLANSYNAWEYFFEQTSDFELEAINKGAEISRSAGDRILPNHWISDQGLAFVCDKSKVSEIGKIVEKYIRLNKHTKDLLEQTKSLLSWESENTLAVFFRGTEYSTKSPPRHAKQPTIREFLDKVDYTLQSNINLRIFVATEELDVRNYLAEKYKARVYPYFDENLSFYGLVKKCIPGIKSQDLQVFKTYHYLIQTYLMAEARSSVLSLANGSAFSMLLNRNRFKDLYIFNLGIYP